eukprot:10581139-Karenia_brevis.AAC.1
MAVEVDGPSLSSHASPVLFGSAFKSQEVDLKDFNSQHLANTCVGINERVVTKRFATASHASSISE